MQNNLEKVKKDKKTKWLKIISSVFTPQPNFPPVLPADEAQKLIAGFSERKISMADLHKLAKKLAETEYMDHSIEKFGRIGNKKLSQEEIKKKIVCFWVETNQIDNVVDLLEWCDFELSSYIFYQITRNETLYKQIEKDFFNIRPDDWLDVYRAFLDDHDNSDEIKECLRERCQKRSKDGIELIENIKKLNLSPNQLIRFVAFNKSELEKFEKCAELKIIRSGGIAIHYNYSFCDGVYSIWHYCNEVMNNRETPDKVKMDLYLICLAKGIIPTSGDFGEFLFDQSTKKVNELFTKFSIFHEFKQSHVDEYHSPNKLNKLFEENLIGRYILDNIIPIIRNKSLSKEVLDKVLGETCKKIEVRLRFDVIVDVLLAVILNSYDQNLKENYFNDLISYFYKWKNKSDEEVEETIEKMAIKKLFSLLNNEEVIKLAVKKYSRETCDLIDKLIGPENCFSSYEIKLWLCTISETIKKYLLPNEKKKLISKILSCYEKYKDIDKNDDEHATLFCFLIENGLTETVIRWSWYDDLIEYNLGSED